MTSSLAWLDFSHEDQKRVREVLKLFSHTDSRDELGIGAIRDAFSETLFPGTSVVQTRARYLLLIPWCLQEAESRGGGSEAVRKRAERNERRLIAAFADAGHEEGLVGRRAGAKDVKTLPSTIYASALFRYRIRLTDEPFVVTATAGLGDELDDRPRTTWSPTLPSAPTLDEMASRGFALSYDEAEWLRARVFDAAGGTLLAHLLRQGQLVDTSLGPWAEPASRTAPDDVRTTLLHAELFSLGMHGAALLYNLLLAEAYDAKGYIEQAGRAEEYRDLLDAWADEVEAHPARVSAGGPAFWAVAVAAGSRVSPGTTAFVSDWLSQVAKGDVRGLADNAAARQRVEQRELEQKKKQARLRNDVLLRSWSGASGRARLTYRWNQVWRLVTDVQQGLREPGAAA